jgi:hypothetical protein
MLRAMCATFVLMFKSCGYIQHTFYNQERLVMRLTGTSLDDGF